MGMDLYVEQVNCPLCGEAENIPLYREGSFKMVRCCSCRFIFLNPRPTSDSLNRFYQHYLPKEESSIESWKKMMRPIFHRAAPLLQQWSKGRRLLDVGTGFGFFLAEIKKRGWEVTGIEISQKAMDYAREVFGLDIRPGPLEKATFPDDYFNVVTGFYVIEHLPDPMNFLRECRRILKPEGLLLLRYPHTTPIKTLLQFFGIKNRLYDLPAHLSDFSPQTIERSLKRAGFEKCRHLIGGHTVPPEPGKRLASLLFGSLSEAFFLLSRERFLLPGVSKTVLAFKGEH